MKDLIKPYLQGASNVFVENKLLKICMVALVIQGFYDSSQISKIEDMSSTVVIPCGKASPYTLKSDSASDVYLFDMAEYVVYLSGNLNADNAEVRLERLLSLFHHSTYAKYQENLKTIKREIQKYRSISHYSQLKYPEPIFIKDNKITITYTRSRIAGDTIKTPIKREMVLTYVIEDSQFFILEMDDK